MKIIIAAISVLVVFLLLKPLPKPGTYLLDTGGESYTCTSMTGTRLDGCRRFSAVNSKRTYTIYHTTNVLRVNEGP